MRSRPILTIWKHTLTGKSFWLTKKRMWGKVYYSFDDGENWHSRRMAAYEDASAKGTLQELSEETLQKVSELDRG